MADKPESMIETEAKADKPKEAGPEKESQGGPNKEPRSGTDRRPQADLPGDSGAGPDEKRGSGAKEDVAADSDGKPTPGAQKSFETAGDDGAAAAGNESSKGVVSEAGSDVDETLEQARRELANLEDRFLRQAADFQNFRKRAIEERALSIDIGRTQVALPMIDVLDDLRRSLEAVEEADPYEPGSFEALRKGVKLVYEKFESELASVGIKSMEVVGKPFDEERHEALMQQPAPPGTKPGTILAEVQKGYMIGDRVLRHARVVVAS